MQHKSSPQETIFALHNEKWDYATVAVDKTLAMMCWLIFGEINSANAIHRKVRKFMEDVSSTSNHSSFYHLDLTYKALATTKL